MTEQDFKPIEEIIEDEGFYISRVRGSSMKPMLRSGKDRIVIREAPEKLCRYDVALYRYSNDSYVLQRMVDFDGYSYVMCGDNSVHKIYGIMDMQIVGVLSEFYRGKKKISCKNRLYRLYVRVWWGIYPLRRIIRTVKRIFIKNMS